jgi:peptidylprolyl isomerase
MVLGLSASLLLGACGKDDPEGAATASPSVSSVSSTPSASPSSKPSPTSKPVKPSDNLDEIKVSGALAKVPKVSIKAPWAVDKTRTKVLEAHASGPTVKAAQGVELNYVGYNARTGKKFDDSFSAGRSATFNLGQVVPGFEKGLVGQHQGSRVLLAIPGSDGYDRSGGNPQIDVKKGDTLVFVVDIVAVPLDGPKGTTKAPRAGLPVVTDKRGKPEITIPKSDPPTKLQAEALIEGKGKKVTASDVITFNYRWVRWSDSKVLEETYGRAPAEVPLSSLVPGAVKGLTGQTVGSRVLLVIPPAESYPEGNETPSISPTETTVMVVDILFAASQ